jgi:hypothetical protein
LAAGTLAGAEVGTSCGAPPTGEPVEGCHGLAAAERMPELNSGVPAGAVLVPVPVPIGVVGLLICAGLVTVGGGSIVLTGVAGVIARGVPSDVAPNVEVEGVVANEAGAGELASGLAPSELLPSELLSELVVAGARQPTPSGAPTAGAAG